MLDQIIEKIVTKEDLLLFLDEIDILKENLFKNPEIPFLEKIKGKLSPNFQEIFEKIGKNLFDNPQQLISLFEDLKEKLLKLPQIKLELAFSPSPKFLLKLRNWLREKTQKPLLLDIVVNPEIVGGAKIYYQGKFGDFSLEKEIEKIYEEF